MRLHGFFLPAVFVVALLVSAPSHAASVTLKVSVAAGDFDRDNVVATVALPPSVKGEPVVLRRDAKVVPAQLGEDGRLSFLIEKLSKGSSATYELSVMDKERAEI